MTLAALSTPGAWAGVYYSGEKFADAPSQWRGFLLDQRTLRNIALKPTGAKTPPVRARYEAEAARLTKLLADKPLSADDSADLGALWIRLGDPNRALEVLRPAQRAHPDHFRLAANLGAAWQLSGDLEQAAAALTQAVRLAPAGDKPLETLHLKLVRLRSREPRDAQDLDDLFGVRYVGADGKYQPGTMAAEQRKKLPAEATALLQRLALALPADGRLLWQLAELASAQGDVATAAAVMDGCIADFGMRSPELRAHRQAQREAATAAVQHDGGHAGLTARSTRPLIVKLDATPLPPIDAKGVNPLPWPVLAETTLDRQFRPQFAKHLEELDGLKVELTGYMQPLGDDSDAGMFLLIEYPVGCWYCETPQLPNIVFVEQAAAKRHGLTRSAVHVVGRLKINTTDPESFLYTISDSKVVDAQ